MDFAGRKDDLEYLERQYSDVKHPFVVLTGRREIGKSTLLLKFAEGKDSLYFEARPAIKECALSDFSRAVGKAMGAPVGYFSAWDDAVAAFIGSRDGRKVIIIDNFDSLAQSDRDILTIFQSLWDNSLSSEDVMLVISGGNTAMRPYLDYSGPLYGRSTGHYEILSIPFEELCEGRIYREAVELYAFTGGVPYYLALCDPELDTVGNIGSLCLRRGGALVEEGDRLLNEVFRDPGRYASYLRVISGGRRRLGDVVSGTFSQAPVVSPYIAKLVSLGILRKDVPVTEEYPERSKAGRYEVADPFLDFWFAFVYDFRNRIQRDDHEEADRKLKESFLDSQASFVFERISRELLRRKLLDGGRSVKVGAYWNSNDEIGVVAVDRDNGEIWAGECGFRESPLGVDALTSLNAKCGRIREFEGHKVVPCMFSVSGYTDAALEMAKETGAMLFDNGRLL